MNHVPFPFEKNGFLIFKNPDSGDLERTVSTEIAESTMEIFQALSYRELNDLMYPLLLNFPDPHQQNFVMMDCNFPVQVITVGLDNVINNIYDLEKKSKRGYFIKSFSGLKMVILIRPKDDICRAHNIHINHTTVELVSNI